ncbi:MAG: hypothetical protein CUN56_09155 [Phototrophicales bacterium]|nr:MAG: hypothetical protein CUN56_09155 [Phototrophicales bacterium]RMG71168.1 MAG: DUF2007 domain-containing protein [Chloroflexota bacterium]
MPKIQKTDQPNNEWRIVYITHDISEAHVVMGRLKHEGIMAILDHMAGMQALGITFGSWGEVRVLVNPADYDRAESILFDESDRLQPGDETIIYDEDWNDDVD